MKTQMTHEIRTKIQQYIKNGIDISILIKDVDIKGEDLSRAIIKTFNRPDDDVSRCNFCQAVIGEEKKISNLNRLTAQNCNFHRTKFLGKVWLRQANVRGSNFREANLIALDYKFTDFRGCDFCDSFICIGSDRGTGALLDENFFKDLSESWGIKVILPKEYESFKQWQKDKQQKIS
jgi:uncharacterized protein YjbI with pentapeptide repeats